MARWISRLAPLLAAVLIAVPRSPDPDSAPSEASSPQPLPMAPPDTRAAATPQTATIAPAARSVASVREGLASERGRELVASLREQARSRAKPAPTGSATRAFHSRRVELSSRRAVELLDAAGLLRRGARSVEVAGVSHVRYRLAKQGRPVFNVAGLLRERDGRLLGRRGRLQLPPLVVDAARLDEHAAVAAALRAAGVELSRGTPVVEAGWFALPGGTVPAWKVVAPAQRPFGTWQVILDARSGQLLSLVNLVRTATGVGSVFDPNKVLSPVPSDVPLFRLDDSGHLQGDIVRVFDERTPAAFRPDGIFRFPEGDPRLAQVSVYRGVTDTGIFGESHGFPPFAEPLTAYTNIADPLTGGEYNNAFYDPFFRLLVFGNGDGTLTSNLGTDLDVAAHETGHHFFETLVEPLILSALDPVLAMHEGVADTIAALVGGDPDIGESTIPGQPFLRSLENTASWPDGYSDDPHLTGLIYGGTNWDLIQLLGADTFTGVLFAALAQLPPDPDEFEYRDAFLQANLNLRGGLGQAQIEAVFSGRGFDVTEFPPEFEGYIEDGIPQSRFLPDSPNDPDPINWNYDFYVFSEFPGSTQISFRTTGTGDVDLLVASLEDETAPFGISENFGSNERVDLSRFTSPSVDAGDGWAVLVVDYPDGLASSYTLNVDATLPPANVSIGGAAVEANIEMAGGYDTWIFQASGSNPVVRVEVDPLDPTLDPLVGVLDPESFDVIAVDDDSGPGLGALIQGAQLPGAGSYALVVLSLTADVDPSIGAGRYRVRLSYCNNASGPNTDGDALRDACDDDDDDDGFIDSQDTADLDPELCQDTDLDGCDDCQGGSFDPFADGPDADADAYCDTGDPDDDNDGCEDGEDGSPLVSSPDADLDFLGSDCDNCPALANAGQEDVDGDSTGDVCDNCRALANAAQSDFDLGADDDSSLPGIQHYGDACDADLDNDGRVDTADFFGLFRPCIGAPVATTPGCGRADLDGNGFVNSADFFGFFRPRLGGIPGPGYTQP